MANNKENILFLYHNVKASFSDEYFFCKIKDWIFEITPHECIAFKALKHAIDCTRSFNILDCLFKYSFIMEAYYETKKAIQ
ncbi:hypothetical protein [Bartonella jaculi]|uniref:Uncharacterized protein n=1 Tax=Bartonella jaculi TaxID=686226 RepID=A0ABP9N2C6_9HYPH